jgi:hypothetical protein
MNAEIASKDNFMVIEVVAVRAWEGRIGEHAKTALYILHCGNCSLSSDTYRSLPSDYVCGAIKTV